MEVWGGGGGKGGRGEGGRGWGGGKQARGKGPVGWRYRGLSSSPGDTVAALPLGVGTLPLGAEPVPSSHTALGGLEGAPSSA